MFLFLFRSPESGNVPGFELNSAISLSRLSTNEKFDIEKLQQAYNG